MINKTALSNDLVSFLAVREYSRDVSALAGRMNTLELLDHAKQFYQYNLEFKAKIDRYVSEITLLIDKNTETCSMDTVEADAARYRHLRQSWKKGTKNRLEWYLPHVFHPTNTTAVQLDQSIDSEISYKTRQK